jgi:hypothetical protein
MGKLANFKELYQKHLETIERPELSAVTPPAPPAPPKLTNFEQLGQLVGFYYQFSYGFLNGTNFYGGP